MRKTGPAVGVDVDMALGTAEVVPVPAVEAAVVLGLWAEIAERDDAIWRRTLPNLEGAVPVALTDETVELTTVEELRATEELTTVAELTTVDALREDDEPREEDEELLTTGTVVQATGAEESSALGSYQYWTSGVLLNRSQSPSVVVLAFAETEKLTQRRPRCPIPRSSWR